MSIEEIGALGGLIFLILALIFVIFYFFFHNGGKKVVFQGTHDHIGLYFEENMDSVIHEFDIASKNDVKKWKTDVYNSLDRFNKSTEELQKKREGIDQRLTALEEDVAQLK
jgi:hypothetical protein